jgi:hypothetical protein
MVQVLGVEVVVVGVEADRKMVQVLGAAGVVVADRKMVQVLGVVAVVGVALVAVRILLSVDRTVASRQVARTAILPVRVPLAAAATSVY